MPPELKETVSRYLDLVPVPPVICSDYSVFDAIAEISGRHVASRDDLFESPVPEVMAFEASVKFGRDVRSQREAEEMFRKGEKRREPTYSVDDIRAIIAKASLTGEGNGRKTVVLFDADRMTVEAANAFLKTLEDVPRGTLFLLTARSRSRMPDTVLSRCMYADSDESALEPDDETRAAVESFLAGDFGPLVEFSIKKKPERTKCLAVLTCFGQAAVSGRLRDSGAIGAASEAYMAIASTNVTPYYELDRALFAIGEGVRKQSASKR